MTKVLIQHKNLSISLRPKTYFGRQPSPGKKAPIKKKGLLPSERALRFGSLSQQYGSGCTSLRSEKSRNPGGKLQTTRL